MRPAQRLVVAALSLWTFVGPAVAQDKTLTEGRPLTRLGDAFPIGLGEGALLAGVGASLQRASADRGALPILFLYGPFRNVQLGLGTTLSSHPHDVDDPHAGDLTGSARVNFGRETVALPSFAAALSVTIPTGVDAKETIYELKGYASKTLGFSLYSHLNASVDFADRLDGKEHQGRYKLAVGANYPLPEFAPLVVAGDVFSDQSWRAGQPNATGIEAGVRYRLRPNLYWDAGVGTEFAGPRDRAVFFITTGVTFGFTIGRR